MFKRNPLDMLSLLDASVISTSTSYSASDRKSKLRVKNYGCDGIHGAREMERRKRQIDRGQLKAENGLVA